MPEQLLFRVFFDTAIVEFYDAVCYGEVVIIMADHYDSFASVLKLWQ